MNITIRRGIGGVVAYCFDCDTALGVGLTGEEARKRILFHSDKCERPVVEMANASGDAPVEIGSWITITMKGTRMTFTVGQAEALAADLIGLTQRRRRMLIDTAQAAALEQPLDADEEMLAEALEDQATLMREQP